MNARMSTHARARALERYFLDVVEGVIGDYGVLDYDLGVVQQVDAAHHLALMRIANTTVDAWIPYGRGSPLVGERHPVWRYSKTGDRWVKALGTGWCKTWTLNADFEAVGAQFDAGMIARNDQLELTRFAGDGRDGSYAPNFTGPIAGCDPFPVVTAAGTSFSVTGTMALSAGDKVLIHSSICSVYFGDVTNVGYWQLVDVVSADSISVPGFTTVTTQQALNANQIFGSDVLSLAQAQRVPQFTTVSIAAGNSITPSWAFNANGGIPYTGGIVSFMYTTLLQGPGNVSANGYGMPGGLYDHQCSCTPGTGDARSGYSGWGASTDLDAGSIKYKQVSTHGGGLGGFCGDSNDCNKSHGGADCCSCISGFSPSGGGGGGGLVSASAGGDGTVFNSVNAAGGAAGGSGLDPTRYGVAMLGPGGGGGGTNPVYPGQGTGGTGGGVVLLWGNTVSTLLQADGQQSIPGRQAGGGGGGTVRLFYLPGASLVSMTMHALAGNAGNGVPIGGNIFYGGGGQGGVGNLQSYVIYPGDVCWESEIISAANVTPPLAAGTLLQPASFLTDWLLDSSAIYPKYQILSSPTGAFAGEETTYPGAGLYFQHGTANSIDSGGLAHPSMLAAKFWRVRACMNTGSNVGDTPSIQDMQLCGY